MTRTTSTGVAIGVDETAFLAANGRHHTPCCHRRGRRGRAAAVRRGGGQKRERPVRVGFRPTRLVARGHRGRRAGPVPRPRDRAVHQSAGRPGCWTRSTSPGAASLPRTTCAAASNKTAPGTVGTRGPAFHDPAAAAPRRGQPQRPAWQRLLAGPDSGDTGDEEIGRHLDRRPRASAARRRTRP